MIRQRMSWYSAQLQPWPGLRRDMHKIQSTGEFRDYMAAGIKGFKTEDRATLTTSIA